MAGKKDIVGEYPDDTVYRITSPVRRNNSAYFVTIPRCWGLETGAEVVFEIRNLRTGDAARVEATVRITGTSQKVTVPVSCRHLMDVNGLATVSLMKRAGYAARLAACTSDGERERIFATERVA